MFAAETWNNLGFFCFSELKEETERIILLNANISHTLRTETSVQTKRCGVNVFFFLPSIRNFLIEFICFHVKHSTTSFSF